MGLFDFFSVKTRTKLPRPNKVKNVKDTGEREACGTVNIGSFTFPVTDFNSKGLMIEPYDRNILVVNQRFRFQIDVSKGNQKMRGSGEALVMKIEGDKLAAAFTIKPYDH